MPTLPKTDNVVVAKPMQLGDVLDRVDGAQAIVGTQVVKDEPIVLTTKHVPTLPKGLFNEVLNSEGQFNRVVLVDDGTE